MQRSLDRVRAGLAGADADGFLDVGYKYLAIADAAGLGRAADRLDRLIKIVVGDHDLDLHLGQKIDDIFGAAIKLGVAFLAAKALGLEDGDALQSDGDAQTLSGGRLFWWELVNHALTLSPRPRLQLRYPEPLELELATPADRRASVRTLLVMLKREVGVDMERFLAELYAAADVRMDREEERRLADSLLMSWDHVRALTDAGFDVQSHSHAHRVLHTLPPEAVTADLRRSRQELESALDQPVTALAYPTGRPIGDAPALRQAVIDAGFRYGFTVERLVPLAQPARLAGHPAHDDGSGDRSRLLPHRPGHPRARRVIPC